MSRMSDLHDDLTTIYRLIVDHRANALQNIRKCLEAEDTIQKNQWLLKLEALEDLLLEIEAQGVQWPEIEGFPPNVVPLHKG